ncbi:amidase [Mycobacterium bohemicum DSM 44277]|uniref:Amidase n=1 Tax=Mycobacterium bohemicum DSM 44277 TaxID=1236609 RepID=A0A0U0W0W6_MYCBE|nr:amidase [Mycobacterium bohemicum DSM 44277]
MVGASGSGFGSVSGSGGRRLPTLTDLLYQLASRAVTSDTLVRRSLHAINASQSTLNAFRVVLTESALAEAAAADPRGRLCVDHADLPDAVWQRVAPHFGLQTDPGAIARMTDESRFYSKDPGGRVFAGDTAARRPVTDEMREAAQRFAEPGYRALRP